MEVDSADKNESTDSIDVFHSMGKIDGDGTDVDDESMKLVLSDDDDVMEDDEDQVIPGPFVDDHNITVNDERMREGREQVIKSACVEIREAFAACHVRGLVHASKWLMELYDSMKPSGDDPEGEVRFEEHLEEEPVEIFDPEDTDFLSIMLGRTYLMKGEYARAAHATEDCTGQIGLFLHFYARYFQIEKVKVDSTSDPLDLKPALPDPDMLDLQAKLKACIDAGHVDGFMLYLMGIISKKLDLKDEAIEFLTDSVRMYPMNWSAWWELAALSCHRIIMEKITLPDHWMRFFFLSHAYFELQLNDAAMDFCRTLLKCGFRKSLFVWTLIAVGHHNKRESDSSIDVFRMIRRLDPFRLEMMDVLSNLLYVRDEREELAQLAREASSVDCYRVETCCIVGNHHSLQNRHEKSVLCFQRALRLNPSYLPAWTLLGHEYMELRNTPAAIQAYRNAIEVNPRDYRAWYGLGQTYDNIKLHNYAVFYYRCAQGLRPYDYRMYVALGFVFENMGRYQAALTCYSKAQKVGDAENVSFIRFGKVYERMKQPHKAAACFKKYLERAVDTGGSSTEYFAAAYKHLVEYSLEYDKLDKAREYADILLKSYYKRKDGREDPGVKVLVKKVEEKEASARGERVPFGEKLEERGLQVVPTVEAAHAGPSIAASTVDPSEPAGDESMEYSMSMEDAS